MSPFCLLAFELGQVSGISHAGQLYRSSVEPLNFLPIQIIATHPRFDLIISRRGRSVMGKQFETSEKRQKTMFEFLFQQKSDSCSKDLNRILGTICLYLPSQIHTWHRIHWRIADSSQSARQTLYFIDASEYLSESRLIFFTMDP